jgi:hypothetical protein
MLTVNTMMSRTKGNRGRPAHRMECREKRKTRERKTEKKGIKSNSKYMIEMNARLSAAGISILRQ